MGQTEVAVIYTDEFGVWYEGLDDSDADSIAHLVRLLAMSGLQLGFPQSSEVHGSRFAFRELRPKKGHSPLRVIYVFDPRRDAVLLIGGDKSNDKRFYLKIVKEADAIYEQYLDEQRAGRHD